MFEISPEMLKVYLARRTEDIATLKMSLKSNSILGFHQVGHQLTGNARNFGFPTLEDLGDRMETLSSKDLHYCGPLLLAEYSKWLREELAKTK